MKKHLDEDLGENIQWPDEMAKWEKKENPSVKVDVSEKEHGEVLECLPKYC